MNPNAFISLNALGSRHACALRTAAQYSLSAGIPRSSPLKSALDHGRLPVDDADDCLKRLDLPGRALTPHFSIEGQLSLELFERTRRPLALSCIARSSPRIARRSATGAGMSSSGAVVRATVTLLIAARIVASSREVQTEVGPPRFGTAFSCDFVCKIRGTPGRTRTCDPRLRSHTRPISTRWQRFATVGNRSRPGGRVCPTVPAVSTKSHPVWSTRGPRFGGGHWPEATRTPGGYRAPPDGEAGGGAAWGLHGDGVLARRSRRARPRPRLERDSSCSGRPIGLHRDGEEDRETPAASRSAVTSRALTRA
jgi:hypothetical protein